MIAPVPENFPYAPNDGAVSGFQPKFIVVRDSDGLLKLPGTTLGARQRDFARCSEVVDWAAELLSSKLQKPKYADLTRAQALRKLEANLIDCFEMPEVYRAWVLNQTADRIAWCGR